MNRGAIRLAALIGAATLAALAITGCASAQKPEISIAKTPPTAVWGEGQSELLRSFRASQFGGTIPMGSNWYRYFTPASVITQPITACLMQELRVLLDDHLTPNGLAVSRSAHFLYINDGTKPSPISAEEAAKRCNDQNVNHGWFTVSDREVLESVFAAWTASGVLNAIASGRNTYTGIDLTKFANQPPPPEGEMGMSIRKFSESFSDHISAASVRRSANGDVEASVTFGLSPIGGCAVAVQVVSREVVVDGGTRSERQIRSIDIGKVYCYIV